MITSGEMDLWKYVFLFILFVGLVISSESNNLKDEVEYSSGKSENLTNLNLFQELLLVRQTKRRDSSSSSSNNSADVYKIHVAAIHIEKSEFPLSKLLFKLALQLAVESVNQNLKQLNRVQLTLSVRQANTCSRQFAGAVAAEEYYTERARLFVVSGCDAAIRSVSRLATKWGIPVLTGAGFSFDLNDKSIHKTLIRVAFSLQNAVEFLVKILKSFQWTRVNLIVDESDPNSSALKQSIERLLTEYNNNNNNNNVGSSSNNNKSLSARPTTTTTGAYTNLPAELRSFEVNLNTITLDLQTLTSIKSSDQNHHSDDLGRSNIFSGNNNNSRNDSYHRRPAAAADNREMLMAAHEDKWPNSITATAVRDVLKQSSMYSRVNILLIPQNYLRKFMLSVYDQGMANGLYTFINMPLLAMTNEDQNDSSSSSSIAIGTSPNQQQQQQQQQQQSYSTSTNRNVFIWREKNSSKNAQAKRAFESLMSIYLRTPTSKAYVYFASKLSNFANTEYAATTTESTESTSNAVSSSDNSDGSSFTFQSRNSSSSKIQLNIDPYAASFYDCLQVYAIALQDSLQSFAANKSSPMFKKNFHAHISDQLRNKRFDNMVTGTILINQNGDRDTEYTLDDMNQMTGKFAPVILYKSDNKQIVRLAKIHWSSDESVGPTSDNVDCNITGSCQSKPISKFFFTLLMSATPLCAIMGTLIYLIYRHLSLESQLVDYWWKINWKDIELVDVRRKQTGGSSLVSQTAGGGGGGTGSHGSSSAARRTGAGLGSAVGSSIVGGQRVAGAESEFARTTITKATTASGFNSSTADVCYGHISLGIYKLSKVALKPMVKFRQARKLMIELRELKGLNHDNLCRFVGIVAEQPNSAFVTEFCSKGSLREFFQNDTMAIDLTFKYSIINDIMAGLLHLHSSEIGYHGRLKSSNCLVNSRFVVKLSDYGLQSLYEYLDDQEDEEILMRKRICSAPEHLKVQAKAGGSKKGDVYSFGLILYEIITNNIPFYNAEKTDFIIPLKTLFEELKTNGPAGELELDVSQVDMSQGNIQALIDLMNQCIQYEINKRPGLSSVASTIKGITKGVTSKKLLENLTGRMEQYTNNLESLVDAKLATLVEEKQKTEELLYQFVPKSIASLLKEGQSVEPEAFDCVTVFYSDIVGFTSLSSESSPMEVIDFLSELYLCFDETLEQYDIYKVDTIGDAYIVASGLPQQNDGKHVIEVARAALNLRDRLARFKIPHRPDRSLEMRVGIHSGPCIAGIVGGLNMPKYCIFGDTVTMGKFMESSGLPMKIHITEESKNLLDEIGANEFNIEARVPKVNRDGIPFQTYWLEDRESRSC